MKNNRVGWISLWVLVLSTALGPEAIAQITVNGEMSDADDTTPPAGTVSQVVGNTPIGPFTFWGEFPGSVRGGLPSGASGTVNWSGSAQTPVRYFDSGQVFGTLVRFYFDTRDSNSSGCGDEACSPFDIRLWSRYGSVSGSVTLEDGTAVPDRIVFAGDVEGMFQTFITRTDENGFFDFTRETGPFPDQRLHIPGLAEDVSFPRENNWGLPVYGDGGGEQTLRKSVSHRRGEAEYRLSVDQLQATVLITGAEMSTVQFTAQPPDKDEDDPSKRPDEEDGPEGEAEDPDGGDETDGSENDEDPCYGAGDPVSVTTGNVYFDHVDTIIGGLRGPVPFQRTYNSQNAYHFLGGLAFGRGWTHSFEKSIDLKWPGFLVLRRSNGAPVYFSDPGKTSTFRPFAAVASRSWIVRSGDSYLRHFRLGGSETYNPEGRLVSRTDRAGNETTLAYDQQGRLRQITIPGGRTLTLVYGGPQGQVSSVLGPDGNEVARYDYEGLLLSQVTYPDGSGYRYAYDDHGQITAVWDLSGRVLERHTYQGDKALTAEIDDGVGLFTFAYEPGRTTVTDALGRETVYEWTEIRALKRITRIAGSCASCGRGALVREWTYDGSGRMTSFKNAEERVTLFGYNAEGDRISRTHALGGTTHRSFDGHGRVTQRTTSDGRVTRFSYEAGGPSSVTTPEGRTTLLGYDANGLVVSAIDPSGKRTRFEYNGFGDLTAVVDPLDQRTEFSYDAYGRRTSALDPLGNLTQTRYNDRGVVTRVTSPDGTHLEFRYDRGGRRIGTTDAAGRTTRFVYDKYGRIESLIDPLNNVARFAYNLVSRMTSVTDARGGRITFAYDEAHRLKSMTYPGGASEIYDLDEAGRLSTRTDRRGVTTRYTYDALGRLLGKSYSDGTPPLSYTYNEAGRLETADNVTDRLAWTYNRDGRILTEQSERTGSVVAYTYDLAGNRESLGLNGENLLTYTYDDASRLVAFRHGAATFGLAYDSASRRTAMTYPNGIVTSYTYDGLSQLTSVVARRQATELMRFDYAHDAVGNWIRKTSSDVTELYEYDALSRLVVVGREGVEGRERFYDYDAAGNRTSHQFNESVTSASYNSRNELTGTTAGGTLRVRGTLDEPATVTVNAEPAKVRAGNVFEAEVDVVPGMNRLTIQAEDGQGNVRSNRYDVDVSGTTAAFAYDQNSNLVAKTEGTTDWTYEWDAENRLTRVLRNGTEIARFAYDALGRRARKTTPARTWEYVYDASDILQESTSDSVVLYLHGPGVDEPLAREDESGSVTYLHADGLASVVKTTDGVGSVESSRSYDPWGSPVEGRDEPGYAFTGREWDPETGLYYYRARYYDPEVGRFLAEDPLRSDPGMSAFAYVRNNPTSWTDPSGQITLAGGIVIGIPAAANPALPGIAQKVSAWLEFMFTQFPSNPAGAPSPLSELISLVTSADVIPPVAHQQITKELMASVETCLGFQYPWCADTWQKVKNACDKGWVTDRSMCSRRPDNCKN